MNPQQPMQDSGVAPTPEQPLVGGEPAAVAPQLSQSVSAPQAQPAQVDSFSQPPISAPVQPISEFNVTPQPIAQDMSVPSGAQPVVQPVAAAPEQLVGRTSITPPAGLAPSSPGIPTVQPLVVPSSGQGTVGSVGMAMSNNSTPADSGKKKKFIQLGVIGGAIVVLLAAGIFGFLVWKSGQIALETYEGDGYTILVPVGYEEKTEEDETVTFTEVSEDSNEQSVVAVGASVVPEEATDEEIKQVKDLFTEEYIKESFKNTDDAPILKDATNVQLNTVDAENEYVVSGTADIKQDDKITGKIYLEFALKDKSISLVIIRADSSDPGLDNKAQTIIDSLKFE